MNKPKQTTAAGSISPIKKQSGGLLYSNPKGTRIPVIDSRDPSVQEHQSSTAPAFRGRPYMKIRKDTPEEIAAAREARIQASVAARKTPWTSTNWRQKLAAETQATGDKLSLQQLPVIGKHIPDILDATGGIGSMATALGSAPLRAAQENSYMPYVTAVGMPLIVGAVAGRGTTSTKAFADNLVNPLPSIEKIKNSTIAITRTVKKTVQDMKGAPKIIIDGLDEKFVYPRQFKKEIKAYKEYAAGQADAVKHPETVKRLQEQGVDPRQIRYLMSKTQYTSTPTRGSSMTPGVFTETGHPIMNINFRELARLNKQGYSMNYASVVDHEHGHLMQDAMARNADGEEFLDLLGVQFKVGAKPTPLDLEASTFLGKRKANGEFTRKEAVDINYFASAGRGDQSNLNLLVERMPFLRETKREMINKNHIQNTTDIVTPEMVKAFHAENTGNRMLGFARNEKGTHTLLAKLLNKTPAVLPVAGAVGATLTAKDK